MTLISFRCDRCKCPVDGAIHTEVGTSGFYSVDHTGSPWAKYARKGEHFVCDNCIQSMPEYRQDYTLPPLDLEHVTHR